MRRFAHHVPGTIQGWAANAGRIALTLSAAGLVSVAGGCTSSNPPTLPTIPPLSESAAAMLTSTQVAPAVQQPQRQQQQPQSVPVSIAGRPTEIYERIARGALACWFGPSGALKAHYVYHADADPPSKGGRAVIVIHERDRSSDNPKGLRAYRIVIEAESGSDTTVRTENLKLSELMAASMDADARRWGSGGNGCGATEAVGWSEGG